MSKINNETDFPTKTAAQVASTTPKLIGSDSAGNIRMSPSEIVAAGGVVEETPQSVLEALLPVHWFSASTCTYSAVTSEVLTMPNAGSDGTAMTLTAPAYYQSGWKGGRERIRMKGSQTSAGSSVGTTGNTVLFVGSLDEHDSSNRQFLFTGAGLSLEYHTTEAFRTWYDPDPGAEEQVATDGGHPMPNSPFLYTAYTDGTGDFGGSIGAGSPTNRTSVAGVKPWNGGFLLFTDGTDPSTGSFHEMLAFDRQLTEDEMIAAQNALAQKWKLWQFAPPSYGVNMSGELHAHRCGLDNYTGDDGENTIEAAKAAVQYGADGWEVDTWLTSDNVNYCMHDSTVDRTTDGTGTVASKTAAQMDALTVSGTTESPPSLQAFLTAVKPYGLPVMINVKNGSAFAIAEVEVDAAGFDRTLIRTLLGQTNRANWVASFPESTHYGMNDTTPVDYQATLQYIIDRKAEGLTGSLVEWDTLRDYHLRAAEVAGFRWFIHHQQGNPQTRSLGYPGYIDYLAFLSNPVNR